MSIFYLISQYNGLSCDVHGYQMRPPLVLNDLLRVNMPEFQFDREEKTKDNPEF